MDPQCPSTNASSVSLKHSTRCSPCHRRFPAPPTPLSVFCAERPRSRHRPAEEDVDHSCRQHSVATQIRQYLKLIQFKTPRCANQYYYRCSSSTLHDLPSVYDDRSTNPFVLTSPLSAAPISVCDELPTPSTAPTGVPEPSTDIPIFFHGAYRCL